MLTLAECELTAERRGPVSSPLAPPTRGPTPRSDSGAVSAKGDEAVTEAGSELTGEPLLLAEAAEATLAEGAAPLWFVLTNMKEAKPRGCSGPSGLTQGIRRGTQRRVGSRARHNRRDQRQRGEGRGGEGATTRGQGKKERAR